MDRLYGGTVDTHCALIGNLGAAIGAARRRGKDEADAIAEGVDDIARETGLGREHWLVFSGRVYGGVVFRLQSSFETRTYGAYAEFACRTLKGRQKTIPADAESARLLDAGVARCEIAGGGRDEILACLDETLNPVIDRRG